MNAELHHLIASGKTSRAIDALISEARRLHRMDIADKLETMTQDYSLLLRFFSTGGKDTERPNILARMRNQAHDLADELRMTAVRNGANAGSRERAMATHTSQDVAALLAAASPLATATLMNQKLTEAEAHAATEAIANGDANNHIKAFWASAMAINLISRHSHTLASAMLTLLASHTALPDAEARIIVGIVGDMMAHSERWTEDNKLTDAMDVMLEQRPDLAQVMRQTVWSFLQTQLTETIATYMRETIGNQISKIAERLTDAAKDNKTIHAITPDDLHEIFGPDTEAMMGKFDRIARWQKSGADVAFTTYKMLKDSSFFRDETNWIRPFDKDCPEAGDVMGNKASEEMRDLADLLEESTAFCDSDKFSMLLTMDMLPSAELAKLTAHLRQEMALMQELTQNEWQMTGTILRTTIAAHHFVHDLYRMLHVGRTGDSGLKKALSAKPSELLDTPMGKTIFPSADHIDAIGRHAVDNEMWDEATNIYALLADTDMATDANWQRKYALCLIQSGQNAKAIDTLRRADLLDDSNSWTKTKLAEAFYKSGDKRAALFHLEAAAEIKKPSLRLALMRADCLRQTNRADEAVKLLAQITYENPEHNEATRLLAETYAQMGRRDDALNLFEKLDTEALSSSDHRQMAILHLAGGDNAAAIRCLKATSGDTRPTPQDLCAMKAMGVDEIEMVLATEATLMR